MIHPLPSSTILERNVLSHGHNNFTYALKIKIKISNYSKYRNKNVYAYR